MTAAALALLAVAAIGLAGLAVEGLALRRRLSGEPPRPRGRPGISVLKPLRGVDDDLAANLESFAAQDWPEVEVLLGLHDASDPAEPVAREAERRWPGRFRVLVHGSALGVNPQVAQLAALAAAARHDLLVVSDSNVRVRAGYLSEIAARLEDPGVGLVTHLIAGVGERGTGALLENLHLAGGVATGIAAAKAVAGRDVVMGKSMAFRRADLAALGGLERVKDLLAEDYVLGQMFPARLG
ncbi:MAG TPA: glycosyltransferase, partial [Thermoanaerobaculia bacterium]|nr:glycosyltransferase [Thermoanaerobaculia bacterium]